MVEKTIVWHNIEEDGKPEFSGHYLWTHSKQNWAFYAGYSKKHDCLFMFDRDTPTDEELLEAQKEWYDVEYWAELPLPNGSFEGAYSLI